MKFPYFSVNAFCKGAFSGNPAGVCILEEWLSTDELQNMASQLYFPETAFIFPGKKGLWSIRWFTPKSEVDLCGHATLAAAQLYRADAGIAEYPKVPFGTRVMIVLDPKPKNAFANRAEIATVFGPCDSTGSRPCAGTGALCRRPRGHREHYLAGIILRQTDQPCPGPARSALTAWLPSWCSCW